MSWVNKNPVLGMMDPSDDEDLYKVELEASHRYQIDIRGKDSWDYFAGYPNEDFTRDHAPNEELTLRDPEIAGIYDSERNYIQGTFDDDSGWLLDARTVLRNRSGIHYILVRLPSWDNVGGTYDVSVIDLGIITISEPAGGDFPADQTTPGRAAVGTSVTGALIQKQDGIALLDTLDYHETYYNADTDTYTFVDPYTGVYDLPEGFELDQDWFSIYLEGGVKYRIEIDEPDDNSVRHSDRPRDTYITIRHSDGTLAKNTGNSTGFNYRPITDGKFYLQVFSLDEYPNAVQAVNLMGHLDSLEHPADYYVISVSVHQTQ